MEPTPTTLHYSRLTASFPGQPGSAGTRKAQLVWIQMRQEMMGFWDDSGISWTICKQYAPRSREITTPSPHQSIFTGQMLFLMPNQQCQSTECRARYQQLKSGKKICSEVFVNSPGNPCSQFCRRKEWLWWEGFAEKGG